MKPCRGDCWRCAYSGAVWQPNATPASLLSTRTCSFAHSAAASAATSLGAGALSSSVALWRSIKPVSRSRPAIDTRAGRVDRFGAFGGQQQQHRVQDVLVLIWSSGSGNMHCKRLAAIGVGGCVQYSPMNSGWADRSCRKARLVGRPATWSRRGSGGGVRAG